MKIIIYKTAVLVLAFLTLLSIVSCNRGKSDGEMTLVVIGDGITEYKIELGEIEITKGLVSVFDHLKETKGLSYDMTGTFINDVNGIMDGAAPGAYVAVYTNMAVDMDVTPFATATEYNGESLTSSGVGALQMHIDDGTLIVIKVAVWEG